MVGHEDALLAAITQELGISLCPYMSIHALLTNWRQGVVQVPSDAAFEALPVGGRIRLLPNHSCLTAACFEEYYVLADEASQVVEAVWHTLPRQW